MHRLHGGSFRSGLMMYDGRTVTRGTRPYGQQTRVPQGNRRAPGERQLLCRDNRNHLLCTVIEIPNIRSRSSSTSSSPGGAWRPGYFTSAQSRSLLALGIGGNVNEGVLHLNQYLVLARGQVLWKDKNLSERFVHHILDRHATSAQRAPKSIRSLLRAAAAGHQATAWASRMLHAPRLKQSFGVCMMQ